MTIVNVKNTKGDNMTKDSFIMVRMTSKEKQEIKDGSKREGLDNMSAYLLQIYRKSKQSPSSSKDGS